MWKSTGWMVRGSNPGRDKRFFSTPNRPHRSWGPPSGQWGSFSGVKRKGREVSHSAPCSAEVKNEWSFTSAFPKCLHDADRENFTVYLYLTVCKIINNSSGTRMQYRDARFKACLLWTGIHLWNLHECPSMIMLR